MQSLMSPWPKVPNSPSKSGCFQSPNENERSEGLERGADELGGGEVQTLGGVEGAVRQFRKDQRGPLGRNADAPEERSEYRFYGGIEQRPQRRDAESTRIRIHRVPRTLRYFEAGKHSLTFTLSHEN